MQSGNSSKEPFDRSLRVALIWGEIALIIGGIAVDVCLIFCFLNEFLMEVHHSRLKFLTFYIVTSSVALIAFARCYVPVRIGKEPYIAGAVCMTAAVICGTMPLLRAVADAAAVVSIVLFICAFLLKRRDH